MFKLSIRGKTTTVDSVSVPLISHSHRGKVTVRCHSRPGRAGQHRESLASRWHSVTVAGRGSPSSREPSVTKTWQIRADRNEGW